MAFVHCHRCDWSQDDFWDFGIHFKRFYRYGFRWGYNPISRIFNHISWNMNPRWVQYDEDFFRDHGVSSTNLFRKGNKLFSWYTIWLALTRIARSVRRQHWWTESSWKKDPNRWKCPKCSGMLCVD